MALPSWSTRTSSTGAASSPTASGWRAGRRLALLEAALRTLADAARGGHGRFLEPLRAQGAPPVGPALGRVVEPVGHRVLHIGRGIGAQPLQKGQGDLRLLLERRDMAAPDAARPQGPAGEAAQAVGGPPCPPGQLGHGPRQNAGPMRAPAPPPPIAPPQ